ncbi:MAG: hypothetical protein M0Z52_07365 [Actinomycetota bacterium]|nr:hypothetical protein [Actinomycetota bacterium]
MSETIEMKRDAQGVYRPVFKKAGNKGSAVTAGSRRTAPVSFKDEAFNALGEIALKHADKALRRLFNV